MGISSNISKLKWLAAIRWSFIVIPVMVLYFQKYGLSYTDIFIIQAIFAILVTILQIPAGYIADIFGRKKVLIIGSICLVIGTGFYSFWHALPSFICGEIFLAISVSLSMGADSALLYETLEEMQQTASYLAQEGSIMLYGRIAEAVGGILGGVIAAQNMEASFILWFIISLIALPLACSLTEPSKPPTPSTKTFTWQKACSDLKAVNVYIFQTKTIIMLMLFYSAIIGFATLTSTWFFQPLLYNLGLPLYLLGVVWAIFNLSAAFFGNYAAKIQEIIGLRWIIILIPLTLSLAIFALGQVHYIYFVLICATLIQGIRGLKTPIILSLINQQIDDKMRATILSYEEMFVRLLFSICAPLAGFFATQSLPHLLKHLAIAIVIFGLFFGWKIVHKLK